MVALGVKHINLVSDMGSDLVRLLIDSVSLGSVLGEA